jgi:hypothetical protein
MKKLFFRAVLRTILWMLVVFLTAALPGVAQNSQQQPNTRPAPNQQAGKPPQGGQKPGTKPAPGNGNGQRPPKPNPPNPNPPKPNPPKPNPPKPYPPKPNPPKPNPGPRPPAPQQPIHRPPQWGRPPAHRPPYHFRPNDYAYLHRYYSRNLIYINRARRPVFVIGGYFPYTDIRYITPLPANVYGYLPPPPPGYQMGYYQGYVVVYDPVTYFIVNVIDLLK